MSKMHRIRSRFPLPVVPSRHTRPNLILSSQFLLLLSSDFSVVTSYSFLPLPLFARVKETRRSFFSLQSISSVFSLSYLHCSFSVLYSAHFLPLSACATHTHTHRVQSHKGSFSPWPLVIWVLLHPKRRKVAQTRVVWFLLSFLPLTR